MFDPGISFFEVQQDFNDYWDGKPIQRGSGYKQFKRWEHLMETRVDSLGFYDAMSDQRAFAQYTATFQTKTLNNNWIPIGPFTEPTGNNGQGRINVIAVHPADSTNIFVGTPSGGLWASVDGGSTWVTHSDGFQNLGVSDIAFDQSNPDIIYIASGDRDMGNTYSYGLLKSTDGGLTWSLTSMQPSLNGISNFTIMHRVLVNPDSSNILLVATNDGVYRSTDTAQTWTEVLNDISIRHMEYKPGNPDIVYASQSTYSSTGPVSTFHRSADGGLTWTQGSLPNAGIMKRCAIGVSPANPALVMLLAAKEDNDNTNDFHAIYKSLDSGMTFTEVSVTVPPTMGSQQWYDWTFAISPTDVNTMYAGGVGLRKSTDGGATWLPLSGIHVDHHFAGFFHGEFYVATDGGIYRTSDGGVTFSDLTNGLPITQYYRISTAATDVNLMLGGSQDNGTHELDNGTWYSAFGGDGMDNGIDPQNSGQFYLSYQFGNYYRSVDGGATYTLMLNSSMTGSTGAWLTPMAMDPVNTGNLYIGYDRIWKSTDSGLTFNDVAGAPLTSGGERLRFIEVAPADPAVIYTTDYHSLWRSDNAGASWSPLTDPGGFIRWIETDPTDAMHAWIASGEVIFETTDGGGSWTNVSGTLPQVAMNCIAFDEGTNGHLYLGTDIGVFHRDGSMSDWIPYNSGLPNIRIMDLDIHEEAEILRAATFGRGVWEIPLMSAPPCAIFNITDGGIIDCDPSDSTYSRALVIEYTNPPATGLLTVNGSGFPISESPQTVVLAALPMDGSQNNVTAAFDANPACSLTMSNVFSNPAACPCQMTDVQPRIEDCDGHGTTDSTDDTFTFSLLPTGINLGQTYSVSGDVNASNIPYGDLHVFDNGGQGFPVSNGMLVFDVIDDTSGTCVFVGASVTPSTNCHTHYLCSSAEALMSPGTYTALGPDQGSGAHQPDADHANWFYFDAMVDGQVSIYSCGGGQDTRLHMYSGLCDSLTFIVSSDDACSIYTSGNMYASELINVNVMAGTRYYFEWDDKWSTAGFDFTFDVIAPGCTDPAAHNFNPYANSDDGSCATCSDGLLNGDETGVDCGGSKCNPCNANAECPDFLYIDVSGIGGGLFSAEQEIIVSGIATEDFQFHAGGGVQLAPAFQTNPGVPLTVDYATCQGSGVTDLVVLGGGSTMIEDNGLSEIYFSLPQELNYTVADVNVSLDIDHPGVQELLITLQSPSGNSSVIWNVGCPGQGNLDFTCDDEGVDTSLCSSDWTSGQSLLSSGVFPLPALSVFDNEALAGTWMIRIFDTLSGNTGSVNKIALHFDVY